MPVRITQVFACDRDDCGHEHRRNVTVPHGGVYHVEPLPYGWSQVGTELICPRHQIVIEPKQPEPVQ